MLFQVAVMKRKKKKKDKEELVWMSDWFIADDPEQAGMKILMEHSEEFKERVKFEDMEILVRPFV